MRRARKNAVAVTFAVATAATFSAVAMSGGGRVALALVQGAQPSPTRPAMPPHGRMPAMVGPGRVQGPPPGQAHPRGEPTEHEDSAPKPINWTDFTEKDQPPYLAALINFAVLVFI